MPIVKKACKYCGKIEAMSESCEACLQCRVNIYNRTQSKSHRSYYLKNRARILQHMKEYRKKKIESEKQAGRRNELPKENHKRRWTVEFIKTEGGYSWRAWFRNPATDRLVKFESGRVFGDIVLAKADYTRATK